MKNEVKNVWLRGGQLCLLLLLLLPATIGISATRISPKGDYPPPNPTISVQSGGYIAFEWDAVEGAIGYKGFYVRQENNFGCPPKDASGTTIDFSSLPAGTYNFYFKSVFSSSESSEYIIYEDVIISG